MRTIEETREELKRHIDETKCRSCVFGLQELLKFIDSDPPCKHKKAFYKSSEFYGHAGRWYFARFGLGEDVCIKFCPDCGERLPEDGVKEKA